MRILSTDSLLAAIGDLGFLLFVAFAFLSWLINAVGAKNKKNQPNRARRQPQRPPRGRDKQLQNEIDQFLAQVKGRAAGEKPLDVVEIRERKPRRRPVSKQPPPLPEKPARKQKPGNRLSKQHLRDSEKELGSSVRKHLAAHMEPDNVDLQVENYLAHDVQASVSEHLGRFAAEESKTTATRLETTTGVTSPAVGVTPAAMLQLLQSPQGIRQAILLSEILQRPRALRRR